MAFGFFGFFLLFQSLGPETRESVEFQQSRAEQSESQWPIRWNDGSQQTVSLVSLWYGIAGRGQSAIAQDRHQPKTTRQLRDRIQERTGQGLSENWSITGRLAPDTVKSGNRKPLKLPQRRQGRQV
jgi:hypothetical protein